MIKNVVNLNDKPLTAFVTGDSLYVIKTIADHDFHYLASFISLKGRVVKVKILECLNKYGKLKVGDETGVVITSCYLWGIRKEDKEIRMSGNHCHWFKNVTEKAGN